MQIPEWLNYDVKPYFKNPIFVGVITLIVILYGSYVQQPLPRFMDRLFKSPMFLMAIFFGIIMIGTQDFRPAFIVALAAASLMHYYNQRLITEAFLEGLRQEGFQVPYDPDEVPLNYNSTQSDSNLFLSDQANPSQILDDPSMDLSSMNPSFDNFVGLDPNEPVYDPNNLPD